MIKNIYIIGNIPRIIDDCCESKFYRVQMKLVQQGFNVVNPLERLTNKDFSFEFATKKNLHELMFCDAVFIMPCVPLIKGNKNLELKWAIDCDLLIINGTFDVISNSHESTNGTEYKTRRKSIQVI